MEVDTVNSFLCLAVVYCVETQLCITEMYALVIFLYNSYYKNKQRRITQQIISEILENFMTLFQSYLKIF